MLALPVEQCTISRRRHGVQAACRKYISGYEAKVKLDGGPLLVSEHTLFREFGANLGEVTIAPYLIRQDG